MTDPNVPTSGQIETPNPVELFWERNKRWVILAGVGLGIAAAGHYGLKRYNQAQADSLWSRFAAASGFDVGYSQDGSYVSFIRDENMQRQFGDSVNLASFYLRETRAELATQIQSDLLEADAGRLKQETDAVKGTPAEPLILWLTAIRHVQGQEWDQAAAVLSDLQSRFSSHFLCVESDYPVQYRAPIESEEDEEDTKKKKKNEPPVFEPTVRGSLVGLLKQQVTKEQEFRAANATLYQPAKPPADGKTVTLHLSGDQKIRIQLFADQAPAHVANFLEKVRERTFDGQRFDEIQRRGSDNASTAPVATLMHFGLEASKNDDRTTWTTARDEPSKTELEFEDNNLSHFPGMLAAAPGKEGKSSGDRFWITGSDAVQFDGERVIFGRVVDEDLEVVESICGRVLADVEMERTGRGQLRDNVTIVSVTIEGEELPPKKSEEEKAPDEDPANGEEGGANGKEEEK